MGKRHENYRRLGWDISRQGARSTFAAKTLNNKATQAQAAGRLVEEIFLLPVPPSR